MDIDLRTARLLPLPESAIQYPISDSDSDSPDTASGHGASVLDTTARLFHSMEGVINRYSAQPKKEKFLASLEMAINQIFPRHCLLSP